MHRSLDRCVGAAQAFLASSWGQRPHRHDSGSFDDVLSLADVDHIVASMGLREPAFRLVRDGATLPRSRVARSARVGSRPLSDLLDVTKVHREFADGATIVLQGLHRYWPPVGRFCRDLEVTLSHPVQANAYITPPSAQGLDVHRDRHDVFAVHTYGSKRWVVHGDGEETPPTLDDEIRAGECLYLPVGTPHAARTERTPSIHLAIGVPCRTWRAVVRSMIDGALERAPLDERLPVGFATDDAVAAQAAETARALLEHVAERVAAADATAALEAERGTFWRTRPPLLEGQLAALLQLDEIDDDTVVRRRPWTRCDLEVADGQVLVHLSDRSLRMPAGAVPALRALAAAERLHVGDLAGHLDSSSRHTLVRRLVREGLLTFDATGGDG